MRFALVLAASYLLGSVLFGPIVARRYGIDIHLEGSGNPGATNVERALGRRAALVVLVLDALKGALVVLAARVVSDARETTELQALAAFAVVLGHCHPVHAPRRGGKGVATALGTLLVLFPLGALGAIGAYVACRRAFGYGSVASLVAIAIGTSAAGFATDSLVVRIALVATMLLVLVRHRDNLGRLRRGEEPR